ncbi:MAG TPA: hypothetical protein DDZ99_10035 [Clostridiales bacterium]|nr:hypothetical protein [Clostridiales bacterium]
MIETKYNGVTKFTYTYNGNGQLYSMTDAINSTTTCYEYDSIGRLIRAREMSGTTKKLGIQNLYDSLGRPSSSVYDVGGLTETYSLSYKSNSNMLSSIHIPMKNAYDAYISYGYDKFDRVSTASYIEDTTTVLTKNYTYLDGATSAKTTTLVRTENFNGSSRTYLYGYDAVGNITSVTYNISSMLSYQYDSLNQLVRENNAYANHSYTYEYDDAGNILYKRTYAYTTGTLGTVQSTISYGYNNANWGDLLTSYNGTAITYDAIGNPLSYRGNTLTWTGRQLNTLTSGMSTYAYKYDESGIRTQKTQTISGVQGDFKTYYVTDGSKILYEYQQSYPLYTTTNQKYYYYDDAGSITGFTYNNVDYYFGKNVQGDVKYIYTLTGTLIAEYCYDAWGNLVKLMDADGAVLSSGTNYTVAMANPFRYRGYYYDSETGFYYLNSRYYDPQVGRFINSDTLVSTGQGLLAQNMFAYCNNNPIVLTDSSGSLPTWDELCNTVGSAANAYADGFVDFFKDQWTTVEQVVNDPVGSYLSFMSDPWNYCLPAKLIKEQIEEGVSLWTDVFEGDIDGIANTFGGKGGLAFEMLVTYGATKGAQSIKSNIESKLTIKSEQTFVPDEYWQRKAPQISTQDSNTTITWYRENPKTGVIEKSSVTYDNAGRQVMRIDYSNHGMPHVHLDPHIHFYWWKVGQDYCEYLIM